MVVLVRRIRSAVVPVVLDDSWPRLLVYALFWLSTAVLATVLLIVAPVFGSFVVGIPLLLVVLVRERGLDGIPPLLFGAAIGSSLVFSIFLGRDRGVFDDGVLIAGLVVFLVWAGTYPVMVRQMDLQHLREHPSRGDGALPARSVIRLSVVRVWMTLLGVAVLAVALARVVAGA
jgi:hypothetical protein